MMKKLLSIILAVMMVMSVVPVSVFSQDSTTNSVFTDVDGDEYYAKAAEALAALGILKGYEEDDGFSFGAEKKITRAEMAAIVCRVLGKEEEAEELKGETDFDDVKENHWASGYVNYASENGIVNGYGDGKFMPEANVKYEEAIKMLVCAFGYGEGIESSGNEWAKPYIEAADEHGITENLEGEKGKAATRGDVAVMVFNGETEDIAAPVISVAAGEYTSAQYVKLSTETEDAEIYYTIDGSDPAENGKKYENDSSVSVANSLTLKAVTVKKGVYFSEVVSAEYKIERRSSGGGGGGGGGVTKYTVSFDLNYEDAEDAPAKQKVKKGECATEPEAPVREGYVFLGWAKDKDGEELFDFETEIKKSTKLYAVWEEDESEENVFTVTFDLNYKGATGAPKKQKVNGGECVPVPENPEREGFAFVGWYVDETCSVAFDFSGEISESVTVYARWIDIDDTTDTDGDGLTDPLEEYYGTDKTKADTDGDGLSDYVEILILAYDPLSVDSDNDGIGDGEEDQDLDGLTNLVEIAKNTNLVSPDTDADGLNDKEEIETYSTDPNEPDTDGDGVSDGKEVELGTDPLTAQSVFNVNMSTEDEDEGAKVSVQIELMGEQVETLSIEPVADETLFPEEMPGYMGKAYDFEVDGEFDSATISFEFDASLLDEDSDPVIYYYDEENQELIELETTVEGYVASATVEHFSKYILVDRTKYVAAFTWVDNWENEDNVLFSNAEIVLVIDDSGSLGGDYGYNSSTGCFTGGNDPQHKRLEASRNFVDKSSENVKIGVVKFDAVIDNMTNGLIVCDDEGKEKIKNVLKFTQYNGDYNKSGIFDSRGMTYMYEAIQTACTMFSNDEDEDNLKVILLFTDGIANGYYYWSNVKNEVIRNDIKIYPIGLSGYDEYALQTIADDTGVGKIYNTDDADELVGLFEQVKDAVDMFVDGDEDGVPDYYEDNTVMFNGLKCNLDKTKKDTDGDGLLDGEEVIIVKEYNADKTKMKIIGKYVSNPSLKDSDGDGIDDGDDPDPLLFTVTDRHLALFAKLSYTTKDICENNSFDGDSLGYASLDELEGWSLIESTIYQNKKEKEVLFAANTYRHSVTKEIVVAFRGTSDGFDWLDNLLLYPLPWVSHPQAPDAENYIKKVYKKYPTSKIYITGHSLGGYLATYAAGTTGGDFERCATFNGLGMDLTAPKTIKKNLKAKQSDIVNYRVEGDVVSVLGTHYGKMNEYVPNWDVLVDYGLDDIEWWEYTGFMQIDFVCAVHDMRNFFTYSELADNF